MDRRSLVGYSPSNPKESDMIEHTCTHTIKDNWAKPARRGFVFGCSSQKSHRMGAALQGCSLSPHSLGDSSLGVSTCAPPSPNSSSLPLYLPSSLNRSVSLQLPLPSHFEISQVTYLPQELKLCLNICYIYMLGFMSLPHNCTHLTCQQSNAQNSPSQVSKVHEPWTSRCSSWI